MIKFESITIENNEQYLRQSSKKVEISDPELHNNIVVLQDYCMQNEVMAMSAVQLGIPKRIVYVKNTNLDTLNKRLTDKGKEETKDYNEAKILINPEIISKEGLTTFWEACASCSWYEGDVKKWYNCKVKRPYKIRVKYLDIEGDVHEEEFEGFESTVLCHEIDHLNGILHIDIADKIIKGTKEERIELRKKEGYTIISKTGDFNQLKSKKIVAIGGGENGRIKSDGTKLPYELEVQDREIIRLTGKENPNFLFIAHSQVLENQDGYFQVMKEAYEKRYGCSCKDLKSDKLLDKEYVQELIDWADIIYEGGGNTLDMINLWKETGFDKVLKKAWEDGKVMCGVSAGANCWFKECSSDSLKIKFGDEQPLIVVECLGMVDGLFVPHCDVPGRKEDAKELLKTSSQVGLSLSNCAALEIIDNEYRLITSDASYHKIEPYGLKSYWENGKYFEKKIDVSDKFKSLEDLLSKNIVISIDERNI